MRFRHPSLVFTLILHAHRVLTVAAADRSLAIFKPDRSQRQSQPHSPQRASLQPRILPGSHALQSMGIFMPEMLVILPMAAIAVGFLISLVAAFAVLVRVFSEIIENCLTIWAMSLPRNQVVIEAGTLRMEFGCSMQPVPWEFIAEFAESQKRAVDRGFAPLFARLWRFDNTNSQRFCYVGLRIVVKGGEVVPPGYFTQ